MIKKAKFYGNEIKVDNIDSILPIALHNKFELKTSIEVSSNRSENKPIIVEFEAHDLLALQFTDNTEWIGHPEDIQEIYNEKTLEKRSGGDDDYLFETQIATDENSRGLIKRALVKVFSVFKAKKVAQVSMKILGQTYDKKIQPHPGLYQVDANFKLVPYKKSKQDKYLVLLHGTLSTTIDAFGSLNSSNTWQEIMDIYGDNILALEHYTLSHSPLQNALDFLKLCPEDCTIDILSHSRGGLIADILAKCDFRNYISKVGFSENELSILKKEDAHSYKLMQEINALVVNKRIKIDKVVRVAAPASGTTILSRRADHFFNLLLNAISIALGVRNPMYEAVKSFLMELISQKENPEVLPGLNSMMPESLFQKMMNAADTIVAGDLYVISGDSDVSGVNFSSLKVILANLFYRTANDLVVDTYRMVHGVQRTNGVHVFPSKGSNTNHFKYFSNVKSCDAIVQAFNDSEQHPASVYTKLLNAENGDRGVILDKFSLEGFSLKPSNITRDVVIIIPGIMGSTLATDEDDQWVNMRNINKGAIVNELNISSDKVKASGIIKDFYSKISEYYAGKYDVITLEFDWRKSLKGAAKELSSQLEKLIESNVNINIIAHSMGGLVARQCMMDFKDLWAAFSDNKKNKFIMLGTPWMGSYLIMEVLTGHSRRVKQLAALDFRNNKKDLLKIFWKYPGVFELLPIEKYSKRPFWDPQFWADLDKVANLKHMPPASKNTRSLKEFENFRISVLDFLKNLEKQENKDFFKNIYYVAGKADETVFDYTFKSRFLSSYEKLVYKATSYGDGSVTWQSGIPKQLIGSPNLYYSNTTHGELANESYIFDGLEDIIATGSTNKLSTQQPKSRSGEVISEVYKYAEPLNNEQDIIKALFDTQQVAEKEAEMINVSVINGDLRISSYPVLVGHFYMDLILSAEKALDSYLNSRLSQRLDIGYYPGKVGESEVFFNLKTQPKGAVICGLGSSDTLTTFLLAKTVKMATLKYAMFLRDNYTLPEAKKYATGISAILIGIGYGKLPLEDSLKGILLGISAANAYIKDRGEGLKQIKDLEIINYYESVASQAYFSLSRMQDNDNRILINLTKGVLRRAGAKKKQLYSDSKYNWWYNLHINGVLKSDNDKNEKDNVVGFKYYSSNGLARVEQEMIDIGLYKINFLLQQKSYQSTWDQRLSKALFEMLIPNEFKNTFRNQANMIIKLDKNAAQIPWELLHDHETDETPAAVSSSFIRQLVTEYATNNTQVSLNNNSVFVVGDPIYNSDNLPQLPAAKEEAEWVTKKLNQFGFETNSMISASAAPIMMELFNKKYKILHFAGHGLYDPENKEVGIAIGDNICIDPATINQLGYVPEFVFINCCYSGTINVKDEKYTRERYRLAANVGTQLIEMGVKAIVISGWAVNDAAAKTFSEVFYKNMLDGDMFGSAVQKARLACYQNHSNTNTWGAYQCYGNQFYRFFTRGSNKKEEFEYVIPSQVYTDFDNLLIAIRDQKYNSNQALKKLEYYLEKVEQANLLDANILEKEALVYNELGETEIALQKFKDLFVYSNGNFSIEALEQYCIIKTNHLNNKTLINDLQEIEFLTLVGKNPCRLNIVGNAYKLASTHLESKNKKIEYLKKAFAMYVDSYKTSTNKYDGNSLDAMSNLIFIGHIIELLDDEKLEDLIANSGAFENSVDIKSYLIDFHQELEDYDKTDLDVSVLIGMAEANFGLMLINNNFKPNIEIDIIDRFKDVFQLLYSPRYIKNEIIQIDFLLCYIKDKTIREQLKTIKLEIEKLLN
ncbi:CHAT domain-containing protein [Lacinutrix cladophorae]